MRVGTCSEGTCSEVPHGLRGWLCAAQSNSYSALKDKLEKEIETLTTAMEDFAVARSKATIEKEKKLLTELIEAQNRNLKSLVQMQVELREGELEIIGTV